MFQNIKLIEFRILATQISAGFTSEEGIIHPPIKDKNKILEEIELIDSMLSVMKSKSLLNRKKGVKRMLDGLLSISVGDDSVTPGLSNNHCLS